MADDGELLRRYAEENGEDAFAELVRRHLPVVYGAALRQMRDAHAAEDVVQTVFASLARQASSLRNRPVLLSWLYTAVHYSAAKARRAESRRQARENAAMIADQSSASPPGDADWNRLRPVLDEAMHEMGESDRAALLLRYFQGLSFAEIALPLHVTEATARKRVERALERLRGVLARRGITSTAAALATTLSAQPAVHVPAHLAAAVSGGAIGGAMLTTVAPAFLMTSTQKLSVTVVLALALGAGLYQARMIAQQQSRLGELQGVVAESVRREQRWRADREVLLRRATEAPPPAAAIADSPVPSTAAAEPDDPLRGREAILLFSGELADAFVQKLGLDDREKQAFLLAIGETRRKLNQHAAAHATIAEGPGGTMVVTIPPFPEGLTVYNEFIGTVGALLGEDRTKTFLADYRGDALSWVFGTFGTGVRTMSISRVPPNFGAEAPGGIRLHREHPGGFVAVNTTRMPNGGWSGANVDSVTVLQDVASNPILGRFVDRLNAMPLLGQ